MTDGRSRVIIRASAVLQFYWPELKSRNSEGRHKKVGATKADTKKPEQQKQTLKSRNQQMQGS